MARSINQSINKYSENLPKLTRKLSKSAEDHQNIFEKLPKIVEDCPKSSEEFRQLPKIAEDGPEIFQRYHKNIFGLGIVF